MLIALLLVGTAASPMHFGALYKVALPQVEVHARLRTCSSACVHCTCIFASVLVRVVPPNSFLMLTSFLKLMAS